MRHASALLCFAAVLALAGTSRAQDAQQPKPAPAPAAKDKTPAIKDKAAGAPRTAAQPGQGQPAVPATALSVPAPEALLMLIRTTLIALNQANQTGNYTVLHDLGSPAFQANNSAAQLGMAFANLRNQKLDLSPVTVVTPQATEAPQVTNQGLLRVVGYFPTQPVQINFQMLFQAAGGKWRLFGLSVTAASAQVPGAATTPQPPPDTQAKSKSPPAPTQK